MRLFVAVALPAEVRERMKALQEALTIFLPGVRWVRPEGTHLTLRFLGEMEAGGVATLGDRLEGDLRGLVPPFEVRARGLGFFPRGRPRVVWVGVEDPETGKTPAALARVAAAIDRTASGLGVPGDERAFRPHLTLGRFRRPAPLARGKVPDDLHAADLGLFPVRAVGLFQSTLGAGGATYTLHRSFPL